MRVGAGSEIVSRGSRMAELFVRGLRVSLLWSSTFCAVESRRLLLRAGRSLAP